MEYYLLYLSFIEYCSKQLLFIEYIYMFFVYQPIFSVSNLIKFFQSSQFWPNFTSILLEFRFNFAQIQPNLPKSN